MVADDLGQGLVDLGVARLHGHRGEVVRRQDALPGLRLLGLPPAELPHRGLGIGDARIDLHRAVRRIDAGELSLCHGDHIGHGGVLPFHRRAQADLSHCAKQDQQQRRRQAQEDQQLQPPSPIPQKALVHEYAGADHGQSQQPAQHRIFVQLQKGEAQQ